MRPANQRVQCQMEPSKSTPTRTTLQRMLGNLVRLLYNKTDSSETVNYNLAILVLGDVHRLQFESKTEKQKINDFVALY